MNATRIPIEKQENICWLKNLKQSATQLGDPSRCVAGTADAPVPRTDRQRGAAARRADAALRNRGW